MSYQTVHGQTFQYTLCIYSSNSMTACRTGPYMTFNLKNLLKYLCLLFVVFYLWGQSKLASLSSYLFK